MPRFFVDKNQIDENTLFVDGADARHIARSLRMAVGDEFIACDGEGYEYSCRLTRIRDERCDADIMHSQPSRTESPLNITLFMAYPKGDKLETVIQKAVELGVSRIVPFESSRCIKRPKADKAEEKTARLMRIGEEAAKQCGRGSLPSVSLPVPFEKAVALSKESELSLFCYEGDGTDSLKSILQKNRDVKSIAVLVGSEGGFSPDEAEYAKSEGLKLTNLGPRILRCETAPDYVLSSISYEFEF